jgi:hypothetical protein
VLTARTDVHVQRASGASDDYVQPDGYGSSAALPDRGQELAAFQQRANEAVQTHGARLEQVPGPTALHHFEEDFDSFT